MVCPVSDTHPAQRVSEHGPHIAAGWLDYKVIVTIIHLNIGSVELLSTAGQPARPLTQGAWFCILAGMSTVPVPAPPLPVSANAQGRNWGSGRPRPRQIHEWNGISDVVAQLHSLESTTATPQVSACQTHPVPLGSRLAATDTRRLVCNSATSHSLVALPMPNDSHYHASLDARAGDQPSYRAEEIKRSRAEELERSRAEDVERSPTDSGSSGSIQSSSHGRPHHDNRRGAHSADESERPAGTGDNKVSATGDGSQTSPRPRRTRALMTRLQGDSLNKLWDHVSATSHVDRTLFPGFMLTPIADHVSLHQRTRIAGTSYRAHCSTSSSVVSGMYHSGICCSIFDSYET